MDATNAAEEERKAASAGREQEPHGRITQPTMEPPLRQGAINRNSSSSSTVVDEASSSSSLDSIARWILSIPPAHVPVLQHMREYRDLLQAVRGLQREHGKILLADNNVLMPDSDDIDNDDDLMSTTSSSSSSFSFLQFRASDDVVLRVLDFLEAANLSKVMQTCSRLRDLVVRNAHRRTITIRRERQLPHVLQLLRAQEHIQGTGSATMNGGSNGGAVAGRPFVRVPTLLLSRCVLVTDSGDADYNGIYHCTGSNGNGFVFTKPREPFQRLQRRRRRRGSNINALEHSTADPDDDSSQIVFSSQRESNNDDSSDTDDDDDDTDDYLLRCIIAKRFSNETLLWYFSKEVVASAEDPSPPGVDIRAPGQILITQRYSFWARLSQLGDASPDLCRYPSQTSILRRNNGDPGWQPLTTTRNTAPPTVELIN